MKRLKRVFCLLLASFVLAPNISSAGEVEVTLGVGVYLGATDHHDEQNIATKDPVGRLSIHYCGARSKNKWAPTWCGGVLHTSSISTSEDRGLSEVEVAAKWVF